jgi:hypothetical protein
MSSREMSAGPASHSPCGSPATTELRGTRPRCLQALLLRVAATPMSCPQVGRMTVEMWKKEKCANSVNLSSQGSCISLRRPLVSPLRRARDAIRAKQILRAVAGRRKSLGSVDESVIGSANDLAQRGPRVSRRQILFYARTVVEHDGPQAVEMWKNELFANSGKLLAGGSCTRPATSLMSPLRRARDASRTKQILRAVAGRQKSPGSVDESGIGSANDLAQRGPRVPRRQILFCGPTHARRVGCAPR